MQVFATTSRAAATYTNATRSYTTKRTITTPDGFTDGISLHAERGLTVGRAHATLLAFGLQPQTPTGRPPGMIWRMLLQEGRALLVVVYSGGAGVNFPSMAHHLAARMRPALQ